MIFLNTNCKNMEKEKDTFVWQSTVTAPEFYPVQVIRGAFYKGDEVVQSVPGGQRIIGSDWGYSIGDNNSGRGPLPDGLGIEWFSFAENKFYSGSFDLPYDTIKKLFNTQMIESVRKIPCRFDEISVGMAPGGMVVVWVRGDSHSVDIGRFQADEAPARDLNEFLPSTHVWYDWEDRAAAQKDFADTFMGSLPQRIANFQKNGLSPGLYDSYRKKYNIRITPNFADKVAIVDEVYIEYYSGEEDLLALEQLRDTFYSPKSPIQRLTMTWSFGRKMQYVRITMDEVELFNIYKQMYEDDPSREIELRVDVNEENNFVRVWFSQPGQEYPRELELVKSDIGIYPVSEGDRHWVTAFKDEYEDDYPYARKDGKKDGK
ncbi:DUF2931 family protein [Dysgonomonas sp. GY617]|nr:DUF2931 family protein [Dysgonomonas sp. GY617]